MLTDRHKYLAETVQSYPASSVIKHAPAGARNSTTRWYMTRGLDTTLEPVGMKLPPAGRPMPTASFILSTTGMQPWPTLAPVGLIRLTI